MSYAFDADCANAAKMEDLVIGYWITREQAEPQNAFFQEGEIANEAARVCIDAGDLNTAEKYYRRGTELGLKEPEPRRMRRASGTSGSRMRSRVSRRGAATRRRRRNRSQPLAPRSTGTRPWPRSRSGFTRT